MRFVMPEQVVMCAGAMRAIVDVMNTLAAAAVATQMIVLGGSVFLPSGSKSSTGSTGGTAKAVGQSPIMPLTLVKRQPSDPAAPKHEPGGVKFTKKQLAVERQLAFPPPGELGSEHKESQAQQTETAQPQAPARGGQNFLQMLLPSDAADRKVSRDPPQMCAK